MGIQGARLEGAALPSLLERLADRALQLPLFARPGEAADALAELLDSPAWRAVRAGGSR